VRYRHPGDPALPVDQPALNVGAAARRWGWKSWRHEVRAPRGRPVSIVPRLPRDESPLWSSARLLASLAHPFSLSLSLLLFLSLSVSLLPPFFSVLRSARLRHTRTRSRVVRACWTIRSVLLCFGAGRACATRSLRLPEIHRTPQDPGYSVLIVDRGDSDAVTGLRYGT